jgi:aspartate carbamoyltransferase catalytic subunit
MHSFPTKLLHVNEIANEQIKDLFSLTKQFKTNFEHNHSFGNSRKKEAVVALVFFEPSTRTRLSFEMAAHRTGIKVIGFGDLNSSSAVKGETLTDSVETVVAMKPDLLVLRHPAGELTRAYLSELPVSLISAGSGSESHPTQALLDLFTIMEERPQLETQRVLLVGDVMRGRVAQSLGALLPRFGIRMGICGPEGLIPQDSEWDHAEKFTDLNQALSWSTICVGLRVQEERLHVQAKVDLADYFDAYGITPSRLKSLSPEGLLMHPGPFVPYLDLDPAVLKDRRCRIRQQVTNGVYIRAALLQLMIRGEA